jgi:hypothetical protein
MLLAQTDNVEAMKSLAENWPYLALLVAAIIWFAKNIADPLARRHIAYLDSQDTLTRLNSENAIKQTALLDALFAESREHSDKLSTIKELAMAGRCQAACPMSPPQEGT